ncbi:MAG TPA: PA2169 family four-helix-bundle protein [Chitinophagaceae bacterium]|nr:PA2169 family four-helix-bundle protein [Chitinophagaceae bacterium]
MSANDKLTEVLNDLIKINNDRVQGYDKAAEDIKSYDVDLQPIFSKMANDSRKYVAELTNEVERLGGEPATGTTGSGKIHRTWMDVKATFSGKDRQSMLESCEFGEDASQKAYREALASDAEISADTRQLITDQQSSLKTSHDIIKKYRDAQKAVNA